MEVKTTPTMADRGTKAGFPDFQQSNVYPLRERTSSAIKPISETREIGSKMAAKSDSPMANLGSKALDSQELRRKHRDIAKLQPTVRSVQAFQAEMASSTISTPQKFSDLGPELPDTPDVQSTPNDTNAADKGSPGTPHTSPTKLSPALTSNTTFTHQNESLRPTLVGSSPSRKLLEVFQQEREQMDRADRLTSMVQSIEDEMHKSGINVNFTKLKDQILQMQVTNSGIPSCSALDGEFVEVSCNSPRHTSNKTSVEKRELPKAKNPLGSGEAKVQTKNWSALFKAQAPSKSMKLAHYPDIKKGKDAHVDFDESQLDDGIGNHCLIGHFLDGKMPLPLLSATARAVWKDHGKFSVKQLGSCYLFEFEDEASKIGVLEGGPYFFSRRYLVLKEWKRMLVPSKNHPSSIPVWVKLHRLPLEFWTHIGFSKIGSAISSRFYMAAAANAQMLSSTSRLLSQLWLLLLPGTFSWLHERKAAYIDPCLITLLCFSTFMVLGPNHD